MSVSSIRRDGTLIVPADEHGRGLERYRRSLLATVVGGVSRGATVLSLLIGTAVLARAREPEEVGVWLLLVTAVNLVGFVDLGIGNAVLTLVSSAQGRDDVDDVRRTVASALAILCALALALALVLPVVVPLVPWTALFGAASLDESELRAAVIALGVIVAVSLPASVSMRVRFAYQEGWIANAWTTAGTLGSLVAVVLLASQPLWVVTVAMLAGVPLGYAIDLIVLLVRKRPALRPRRGDVDRERGLVVLRSGFLYFVLGAAVAVGYQSDALIVSHHLGSDRVADYVVPARLFLIGCTAVQLLVMPLWPAYTEALARSDVRWVRTTLRRSMAIGVAVAGVPAAALLVLAPYAVRWLSDQQTEPELGLLLALAGWAMVMGVSAPLAAFLNGAHILRPQLTAAICMTVLNIVLSNALVSSIGIAGPVVGSIVAQALCILVPFALLLRGAVGPGASDADLQRWVRHWAGAPVRAPNTHRARSGDHGLEATIE